MIHIEPGTKLNDLTVRGPGDAPEGKKGRWLSCDCYCGRKNVPLPAAEVNSGRRPNCGECTYISRLVGREFGLLTVIGFAEFLSDGIYEWACKCACGNRLKATTTLLNALHEVNGGCGKCRPLPPPREGPGAKPEHTAAKVLRLRLEGRGTKEIADLLGVTKQAVNSRLNKLFPKRAKAQ